MENKLEPQKSSLQALEPSVLNWMEFSTVYEQEEEGERGGGSPLDKTCQFKKHSI